MPVKEKLSRISLYTLIPSRPINRRITIKEEPLSSAPFVISPKRNIHTKFFGRVKELDYIRTLYSQMLQRVKDQNAGKEINLKPIAVSISGEAGIGKSRLVNEFVKRILPANSGYSSNTVMKFNCTPGEMSSGFSMISSALKEYFRLPQGSLKYSEAYPTIRKNAADLSSSHAAVFSKIVTDKSLHNNSDENNIQIKSTLKDLIFHAARRANAASLPLIIVVDDMQWAAENEISLIENVLRSVNVCFDEIQPQLMPVFIYRDKYRLPKGIREETELCNLTPEPLDEKALEGIIAGIAGENFGKNKSSAEKIKSLIIERSDGNPFNTEEWSSYLIGSAKLNSIPASIKSLMADKMKGLDISLSLTLKAAAIFGRKFNSRILSEVIRSAGVEVTIKEALKILEEKRYVKCLSGDLYEFRHDKLHETIYRLVDLESRKLLHNYAAEKIETVFANNLNEHHYELAYHYSNGGNVAKMVEYFEKAGDNAKNRFENDKAIKYYSKLLTLLGNGKQKKFAVTDKLAAVYRVKGEYNSAINLIKSSLKSEKIIPESLNLIITLGELNHILNNYGEAYTILMKALSYLRKFNKQNEFSRIYGGLGNIFLKTSKYNKANYYFNQQLKFAVRSGRLLDTAKAHDNIGVLKRLQGKYESALTHYLKCSSIYEEIGDKQLLGIIIDKLGTIYYYMGYSSRALSNYKRSLGIHRTIGFARGFQNTLGNIGILYSTAGDNKNARKMFFERIELCIRLNDEQGLANTCFSLGNTFLNEEKFSEALSYYNRSIVIFKKLKNLQSLSKAFANIGIVYQSMKDYLQAGFYISQQLSIDKKLGNMEGIVRGYVNKGNNYGYLREKYSALLHYKKAVRLGRKLNTKQFFATALYNLAEAYCETGRLNKAEKHISELSILCAENDTLEETKKLIELKLKYF